MSDPSRVEAHVQQTRDFAAGNIYNLTIPSSTLQSTPALDIEECAATILRRYRETSAMFAPLFLRSEHQHSLSISVAPASSMWTFSGSLNMPDIQIPRDTRDERSLTEVADEHAVLVLRGAPGAGKTTACRFLAYRAAETLRQETRDKFQLPPLPVFVELNRYQIEKGENASDALARLLALSLREAGALHPSYMPSAIDGRKWLADAADECPLTLFLDGLNEVAPGLRNAAEFALRQMLDTLRGGRSRIVITTRRHGFEVMQFGNIKIFDLQPFTQAAIERYLQDRLSLTRGEVEDLYRRRMGPRLQLHSSNPLMLNVLCDVLQQGETPPTSRGELLRVFIEGILQRWEISKSSHFGQRQFSFSQKIHVLEILAFRMQVWGRSIPMLHAMAYIGSELHLDQESAEAILNELCTNHLLLIRHAAIEFSHHTLQEFSCAQMLRRMWDESNEADFESVLSDPRWWEPLGMIGGLLTHSDFERFVRRLGDRPVLIGMVLGNASPATFTEKRFVELAGRRARFGVIACVAATQFSLLLAISVVCSLFFSAAIIRRETQHLLALLGFDPLNGLPISLAWILLSLIVLAAANIYNAGEILILEVHDHGLKILYKRWIEPWLLALHYTNTPAAHQLLDKLQLSYAERSFIDHQLRQSLKAFAPRRLNEDTQQLLACLDVPGRATYAVALLSLAYDCELASGLVQRVASRSDARQQAEVALYLEWLQRHSSAKETLLPLLESLMDDLNVDFKFRRNLARQLRRERWSRTRPAIPPWQRAWSLLRKTGQLAALPFRLACGGLWIGWLITAELSGRRVEPLLMRGWRLAARAIEIPGLRPGPFLLPELIRGLKSAEEVFVAERLARKFVRLAPRDPVAYILLGELLEGVGKFFEADTTLAKAIDLFPGSVRLLTARSRVLGTYLNKFRDAATLDSVALGLNGDDAILLRNFSQNLRMAGLGNESEAAARRALELDPQNAWSWIVLARTFADTFRVPEADALLLEAISRFPSNSELLEERGNLLRSKFYRPSEAAELYRAATFSAQISPHRLRSLFYSLEEAGLLEEAESVARHVLQISPDRPSCWIPLARVLARVEKFIEADSLLACAIKRFPRNLWLLVERSDLYEKRGRYEEAVALAQAALQLAPNHPILLRNASWALRCVRSFEEAELLARRAIDQAPGDLRSIMRLSEVLLEVGRFEEVRALLATHWETTQDSPFVLEAWVVFALVDEDIARAQEAVNIALSLRYHERDEGDIWQMYRAEVLLRQDRKEEALACLEGISKPPNGEWFEFLRLAAASDESLRMARSEQKTQSLSRFPCEQVRRRALLALSSTDLQKDSD
jgi:tetratricopeptide (TPR) repeat protein